MIYEREKYDEAKTRFFRQVAKMDLDLSEYVEKQGGKDNLNDGQKKSVAHRENGLVILANLPDAADDYIEFLENYIDELMKKNRRLAHEAGRSAESLEGAFLPNERGKQAAHLQNLLKNTPIQVPKRVGEILQIRELTRKMVFETTFNNCPTLF